MTRGISRTLPPTRSCVVPIWTSQKVQPVKAMIKSSLTLNERCLINTLSLGIVRTDNHRTFDQTNLMTFWKLLQLSWMMMTILVFGLILTKVANGVLIRMMMTCDAYSHSPVPLAIPTLPKSIFNICTFKLIAMIITITVSIIITLWWLSANLACGQKSPSSQFLCRINRQRTEQWISLAALENNYHNVAAIAGVGTLVLHNSHISNTSCPLLLPLRSWWGRVSVLRLGCFKKLLLRGKKLLDKISHHPRNIR